MADEAVLTTETAQRILRDCRRVEDMLPPSDDGQPPRMLGIGRYAKITKCADASGFAEIQFCTGNRDSLEADDSLAVKCGLSMFIKFLKVGDLVIVLPIFSPDIHWEAIAKVVGGALFKDPQHDGSVLANPQDDPDVEVLCTDEVEIP